MKRNRSSFGHVDISFFCGLKFKGAAAVVVEDDIIEGIEESVFGDFVEFVLLFGFIGVLLLLVVVVELDTS